MEKPSQKAGIFERGANFLEKAHYGIGAVALGGFAVEEVAGAAIIQPEALALVGVYELAHGFVIGAIKNWFKGRKNQTTGRVGPASANAA